MHEHSRSARAFSSLYTREIVLRETVSYYTEWRFLDPNTIEGAREFETGRETPRRDNFLPESTPIKKHSTHADLKRRTRDPTTLEND
jgi:hypothetical protein